MPFPIRVCAVCEEEFELKPDKPGFANRCPRCSEPESDEPVEQRPHGCRGAEGFARGKCSPACRRSKSCCIAASSRCHGIQGRASERDGTGRKDRRASPSLAVYAGGVWLDRRVDAAAAAGFPAGRPEGGDGDGGHRRHHRGAGAADAGGDALAAGPGGRRTMRFAAWWGGRRLQARSFPAAWRSSTGARS